MLHELMGVFYLLVGRTKIESHPPAIENAFVESVSTVRTSPGTGKVSLNEFAPPDISLADIHQMVTMGTGQHGNKREGKTIGPGNNNGGLTKPFQLFLERLILGVNVSHSLYFDRGEMI